MEAPVDEWEGIVWATRVFYKSFIYSKKTHDNYIINLFKKTHNTTIVINPSYIHYL